ncbi:hypothetical protein [Maridesulfovibrio sp.]|uniref:hypothetical protein n=1 Tax=Maridesulfovibrio sp. TaxID=2795000 RepID=UPI003AFFBEF4
MTKKNKKNLSFRELLTENSNYNIFRQKNKVISWKEITDKYYPSMTKLVGPLFYQIFMGEIRAFNIITDSEIAAYKKPSTDIKNREFSYIKVPFKEGILDPPILYDSIKRSNNFEQYGSLKVFPDSWNPRVKSHWTFELVHPHTRELKDIRDNENRVVSASYKCGGIPEEIQINIIRTKKFGLYVKSQYNDRVYNGMPQYIHKGINKFIESNNFFTGTNNMHLLFEDFANLTLPSTPFKKQQANRETISSILAVVQNCVFFKNEIDGFIEWSQGWFEQQLKTTSSKNVFFIKKPERPRSQKH